MRRFLCAALLLTAAACSRKVVVTTPSSPVATPSSVKVTNTTGQGVTVYVTPPGGSEFPIGSVPPNTTAVLTINGVAAGTAVRLRAALADGSRSYSRDGVALTGVVEWRVP
jgi:hypothetical protein